MTLQDKVLSFWFGDPSSVQYGQAQSFWFQSTPEIDQNIKDLFEPDYNDAVSGKLPQLLDSALGSLTLVILLDQLPRNMYRNTAKAFATDSLALDTAKHSIKQGFDKTLPEFQRKFFYLPFMHSENLGDQEQCIALYKAITAPENLDYAIRHRDIIARFGRFPHRNAMLNRTSTAEEIEFLKQPGSSF